MLVLTRKLEESIVVGDDVLITVVEIRGDKVRLGFTAPADVSIDRVEVRLAKVREAQAEAEAQGDDRTTND